jgi:hypothetical protein
VLRWMWLAVLSLSLTGCDRDSAQPSSPSPPALVDLDADGVTSDADCNDDDSSVFRLDTVFEDTDGDEMGAGLGELQCIGLEAPTAWSLVSGDCDDTDPSVFDSLSYEGTDLDRDGYFALSVGEICTDGELPIEYSSDATGLVPDCDDDDFSIWRVVVLYRDVDGDGVGSGAGQTTCMGNIPPPEWSMRGYDPVDSLTDPDSISISDFDLSPAVLTPPQSGEDRIP